MKSKLDLFKCELRPSLSGSILLGDSIKSFFFLHWWFAFLEMLVSTIAHNIRVVYAAIASVDARVRDAPS